MAVPSPSVKAEDVLPGQVQQLRTEDGKHRLDTGLSSGKVSTYGRVAAMSSLIGPKARTEMSLQDHELSGTCYEKTALSFQIQFLRTCLCAFSQVWKEGKV